MGKNLSAAARKKSLGKLSDEVFDLAIIGGGITGAGVARDAASRGMKVALIEMNDFASGTSSRSSKLIHGGIRYLENLEFGLVFEALSERQKLFDMAPHLVHPLRFILPIYKTGRVPAWKMGLGMWVYDALSLFEAPELHTYYDRVELARELPELQTEALAGGFAYYDAYMDDDRLVIETLRAAKTLGAEIVNYVKATGAEFQNGKISALPCEDREGGFKFDLKARHYISSVGPWTDKLGADLFGGWQKKLRPSKGVHLTFSRARLPLKDAVVMGAEKRIVFAIPRHEMVIVGTTDTDYPGDPASVSADHQDVEYLLGVIDRYFPGAKMEKSDIIGVYAGVRPLIDDHSETESKTSREHEIWTDPRGCTFVAGGKYTTYRNMASQTVDVALEEFPMEDRARFSHPDTDQPLNPKVSPVMLERARREHKTWADVYGVPNQFTGLLADRHGLEAREILAEGTAEVARSVPRSSEEWMWCAEAIHAVEHTMCLHLRDFYLRRSPLVLSRRDHGFSFMNSVAQTMAGALGWTDTKTAEEINALQKIVATDLAAIES